MSDPSAIGIMEGAYFVSRHELLDWLRSKFALNISKVEDCGSGAIYVQIVDSIFPNKVPMRKVKWGARQEYECMNNFKLLQSVFEDCGVKKHIDIFRLIKFKYQDNLEFLQWLRSFHEKNAPHNAPYDPIERRRLGDCSNLPSWALPPPGSCKRQMNSSIGTSQSGGLEPQSAEGGVSSLIKGTGVARPRTSSGLVRVGDLRVGASQNGAAIYNGSKGAGVVPRSQPGSRHLQSAINLTGVATGGITKTQSLRSGYSTDLISKKEEIDSLKAALIEKDRQLNMLKEELEGAEKESHFFYGKLRQLEILCSDETRGPLTAKEIQEILYSEDELPFVVPQGDVTNANDNVKIDIESQHLPTRPDIPLKETPASELPQA